MSIKSELQNLKTSDLWSLLLFALFKLKDTEDYSALCELAYILDKPNLLKLCEYFGGLTITIPTIEELESLLYGLMLYQYVDIDKKEYDEAAAKIKTLCSNYYDVKQAYLKIKEVLQNYDLQSRGKV